MILNLDSQSKEIKELKKELANNTNDIEVNKQTLGYRCKNYCDISKTVKLETRAIIELGDNSVRIYNEKEYTYVSSQTPIDYSKMKKGRTYTLSADVFVNKGVGRLAIRTKNENTIKFSSPNITSNGKYKVTFVLPDYECYVSLFATTSNSELGDVTYSNIQIEDGDVMTDYEPYRENIYNRLGGCHFKYENGKFYIGHEEAETEV